MNIKNILFIIVLALYSVSCNNVMTNDQVIKYILDSKNGLFDKKELNDVSIMLSYKPYQLLAKQEYNIIDSLTNEKKQSILNKYSKQYYFVLSLSKNGQEILSNANNRNNFSTMVHQFAFGMGSKAFLLTAENDTLKLLDFHAPRYYGMSSKTDILFAFEKNMKKTDYVVFHLYEFGLKTGNTRFKFSTHNISEADRINIVN